MKVKVCGITNLKQAEELQQAGADYLGFIFYAKSKRYVLTNLSLQEISQIKHSGKVGVFVNADIHEVVEIAQHVGLHFIQLHGDEDLDYILNVKQALPVGIKLIKVIRVGSDKGLVCQQIQRYSHVKEVDILLFDTDGSSYGGTGKSFDWNFFNDITFKKPYWLSGGIDESLLPKLKTLQTQPETLDINSRFEIAPGLKDVKKVRSFLNKVKEIKNLNTLTLQ